MMLLTPGKHQNLLHSFIALLPVENSRRNFLKNVGIGSLSATLVPATAFDSHAEGRTTSERSSVNAARTFNGPYTGEYLNRFAFPLGGIGAGMYCIEGSGAFSHMSVRHKPDVFKEP